jgi:hypothetical protein
MQFRTIRTALDHEGEVTYIRDLTPRSRGPWFCRSATIPCVCTGRMTAAVISNMTWKTLTNAD